MIAFRPVSVVGTSSSGVKPRRLSISLCRRTRSARPPPSSPVVSAMLSRVCPAFAPPCRPGCPPDGACPGSVRSLSLIRYAPGSLDDDLPEQDPVHLLRLDDQVDAPQEFRLEPVDAGGAFEISGTQFPEVDLEHVHDARHHR